MFRKKKNIPEVIVKKKPTLNWSIFREQNSVIFILTNIFGIACNDTILFTDVKTGEQNIYCASGGDAGDGISKIAGNKSYSVFALAERKFNPRVFIFSYPDFAKIEVLSGDNVGKYIELRFAETEYLVALTGYPDYKIRVWNYRMGALLVERQTFMESDLQEIQCNISPFLCAQYAQDLKTVIVWEIHVNLEHASLIKRKTEIPFLTRTTALQFIFGIEGNMYMVDEVGNFYTLQISNGTPQLKWKWNSDDDDDTNEKITTEVGTKTTTLTLYRGGVVICGSTGAVRHIKKINNEWLIQWELQPEYPIYWIMSVNNYETIYALARDSTIYELNESADEKIMIQIGESENDIRFCQIIKPDDTHIAVLTRMNEIRILDIENRKKISYFKMGDIQIFMAHPDLPVLYIANLTGRIYLLSLFWPDKPDFLVDFQLSDFPIRKMKITSEHLVVHDKNGEFFVLSGSIGTEMKVIHTIPCGYPVFDFEIMEKLDSFDIYVFILEKDQFYSENILIFNLTYLTVEQKLYKLPHKYISVAKGNNKIFAAPLHENFYHVLSVQTNDANDANDENDDNDDASVVVTETIQTAHQVRFVKLIANQGVMATCSFDGFVCIFNMNNFNLLESVIMAGHRRDSQDSINTVQCVANLKFIVTLSRKGVLKCFEMDKTLPDILKDSDLHNVFNNKTISPVPVPDLSWVQFKYKEQLELEAREFQEAKYEIIEKFKVLQEKVQKLIDENEALEDEEDRLPLSSFNLARELAEEITEKLQEHRDLENESLALYISDQDRIKKWIIEQTWNKMKSNSFKINGIFSSVKCENYALVNANLSILDQQLNKYVNWREMESIMCQNQLWYPWLSKMGMQVFFRSLRNTGQDSKMSSSQMGRSEMDLAETQQPINREPFALSGTGTHKYIQPHASRYNQLESVTFNQMFIENFLSKYDILNLKLFFNKDFVEMKNLKYDQVGYVKHRNERLRVIQSEMNALAALKNSEKFYDNFIEDPTFLAVEQPETIIKVESWEVKVKPYISPSQQKILDEIAYQAELRRLALLADDFRERALITMMDGVLEKRWEDEIKKDPIKPDCLIKNKDPAEYTKDDLKAINDYEDKLNFIHSERDRYQVMLEEEEVKIQSAQDDQILKFNTKCGELFLHKLRVDAAIKQEEIKLLRMSLYNLERIKIKAEEQAIRQRIVERKVEVAMIQKSVEAIDKRAQDCRSKYEQLMARDRILDRQFKTQFSENAPSFVLDQAYKIFKRRPKMPHRAWATAAVFSDMAARIVQKKSTKAGIPLPDECYDFLNLVDNIDSYALSPNTIDTKLWDLICKMRRNKIESEFKLKACGANLADVEGCLNNFLKELTSKKALLAAVDKELIEINQKYRNHLKNRTVQIVLPMGLVEVGLSGRITDFEKSLLLSSSDVAEINAVIKRAGLRKIKAMQKVAVFRRKVIFKEWEHKVLRMTIADLKKALVVIEHTKISIEIRQWLREKTENRVTELTSAKLSQEIENKTAYLRKQLEEIDERIADIEIKIKEQKHENVRLDKNIQLINIDVTEQNLQRDVVLEEKELREQKERMIMVKERANLVRKVQADHGHILELATMLELQRLRTFPTLSQKSPLCSN